MNTQTKRQMCETIVRALYNVPALTLPMHEDYVRRLCRRRAGDLVIDYERALGILCDEEATR